MSAPKTVYDPIAQSFHWGIALVIACLFFLAAMMDFNWNPDTLRIIYTSHKSLGLLVLVAMALRLVWRLTHTPPSLEPLHLKRAEALLAQAVHYGIYLVCFLMPLSGWAMVSGGSRVLTLFGLWPAPMLPVHLLDPYLSDVSGFFRDAHGYLGSALMILLGLHIAGAIKHHFIDKNDLMARMVPRVLVGPLNRLRGVR